MAIKSLLHSSLSDNRFYRSMLVGNDAYEPLVSKYQLLQTHTVSGTEANVIFENLTTSYGSDFQHLQVRATMRTNRGSTGDASLMRINDSSASVYSTYTVRNNAVYNPTFSTTTTYLGDIVSNIDEAYNYATMLLDITDPFESDKNTSFNCMIGGNNFGSGQTNNTCWGGGVFGATTAVNKLDFYSLSQWVAGTTFSLYGIKAA